MDPPSAHPPLALLSRYPPQACPQTLQLRLRQKQPSSLHPVSDWPYLIPGPPCLTSSIPCGRLTQRRRTVPLPPSPERKPTRPSQFRAGAKVFFRSQLELCFL